MRLEGNSRGINRNDYRQFADFLGLSHNRLQPRGEGANSTTSPCNHHSRPIGMVYGEKQCFDRLYDTELSLVQGTIFEELNMPFYFSGCKSKSGEGCL